VFHPIIDSEKPQKSGSISRWQFPSRCNAIRFTQGPLLVPLFSKQLNSDERVHAFFLCIFSEKTKKKTLKCLLIRKNVVPLHRNFAQFFKNLQNVLRSREEKRDLWHLRQKQY
jgi:hypothetical protein